MVSKPIPESEHVSCRHDYTLQTIEQTRTWHTSSDVRTKTGDQTRADHNMGEKGTRKRRRRLKKKEKEKP